MKSTKAMRYRDMVGGVVVILLGTAIWAVITDGKTN